MDNVWIYQNELQTIQSKIDVAIADVQKGFFNELSASSSTTLKQYQNHTEHVEVLHDLIYDRFDELADSECKTMGKNQIRGIKETTGFYALNCAKYYYNGVTKIINESRIDVKDFNLRFSELQQIVIKGFIKQNIFLTGEEAMKRIEEMMKFISELWEEKKPNLDKIRTELKTKIAKENKKVSKFHECVEDWATYMFNGMNSLLEQCEESTKPSRAKEFDKNKFIEDFKVLSASSPNCKWES
jgi:hypothetical protein